MTEINQLLAQSALGQTFVFLFGLLFGSFFNVCILRLPEDESIGGRSRCPHCRKQINWYDNLPLISFARLGGKTRCCRKTISLQYPIIELLTGLMFLGIYLYFGPTWQWACYTVFCSGLLVLSVIDFYHQIIPDEISLGGIPLGVAACFLTHDITWMSSLWGLAIGGGIFFSIAYLYERFTGQEGLGGGDVKLLGMLGAWLGVESILILIVISTMLGSVVGLAMMVFAKANSKAAIPFGPFLAVAAVIYLFGRSTLLPWFYPLFFS